MFEISKFISLNSDSIQTICLVVSLRHIYSASVEERATVFCFRCKDYFAADVGHFRRRDSVVGSRSRGRARRRREGRGRPSATRRGNGRRDGH